MKTEDIILGHCQTNLDDYDCSKVKGFAKVPEMGERVACNYKGHSTTLRVCGITHDDKHGEPYLIIELHN